MSFSEKEKTRRIKEELKESITEETTWPKLKTQFAGMPSDLQQATFANIQEEIDRRTTLLTSLETEKENYLALKEELEEAIE